ncbi:MAG TPA: hypothetical protein IGS52_24675 [Oscillatoriaceae cyanobacterium M33_DOE_052]|uniref:Uncharacterized protein n=1 Tax=Planktothricoides sp. SpSt-374 TaxID=2282167 RepID=A0A7C3ZYR5_9CYAN|nr:hypothetical protein [Oscillatoriaceae cyanobacterium M33_DOE_052]
MARKRLSDVIKEEVKKSPDNEGETASTSNAQTEEIINQPTPAATSENLAAEVTTAPASAPEVSPLTDDLTASNNIISQLEANFQEIENLNAELVKEKEALQEELNAQKSLGQKLQAELKQREEREADLQTDLATQKNLVQKFTTELQELGRVKAELEAAKTAALELASAQEKLLQELQQLRQEQEKKPTAHLALKITRPPITFKPKDNVSSLSNRDIGWFD